MIVLQDGSVSLSDVEKILYDNHQVEVDSLTMEKVEKCHLFLSGFAQRKIIYGISTGFGPMAQYRVDDEMHRQLQYNLIRSHSAGTGKLLPPVYARAAMVARLSSLMRGYSGIHSSVIGLLVEMINRNICPTIYEHGGVGASGDLVQLAHLALNLIGEGEVIYEGKIVPAAEVFARFRLHPVKMHIREGLALINGTSVMTGIGLINAMRSRLLLNWSVWASSVICEVVGSFDDHFSTALNDLKNHEGQQVIARGMQTAVKGSSRLRNRMERFYTDHNHEHFFTDKVQEYYSLRCVPQVLGPVYDTWKNVQEVLVAELNSVNDNPVIDAENRNVYHGGNFHGDYVSLEMDKLRIVITKLTMLAERQLNYLMHDRINNILPPFVNLGIRGLNYGMQAVQFTATSTTAECQTLSNPMYVHSIPNNNDNQDIVSMGTNAASMTRTVIENSFQVLAIEMMAIVQAVDYLKIQDQLSPLSRRIYSEIRELVPVFVEDTPKYEQIRKIVEYLEKTDPGIIP